MIDTVRLYTSISEDLYNTIQAKTDVIAKFNVGNNQVYYTITNGHIERFFWQQFILSFIQW